MANVKISGMTAGTALTGTEAFESVQSSATVKLTSAQIKTYVDRAGYTYNVPVTGFSLTIGSNIQYLILEPAGNLATGTITMPASPPDGYTVGISSTKNVTSLTLTPNTSQTIPNTPTALTAGVGITFLFRSANSTWYRISS
jgi:hypothetical protein